jgi:hypothetical protein
MVRLIVAGDDGDSSGEDPMRDRVATMSLVIAVLAAASLSVPQSAAAAAAYCPNPAHARPAKVPRDMIATVAKMFQVDSAALGDAAFVRCVGAKLVACYVGANLNCGKADTRRTLPGATAWCAANPGSKIVPMSATGHDTIYEWSCNGNRAIAGKSAVTVDPQGYIADNWKDVP